MARRFGMLDRFEDPIDASAGSARSTVRVVLRPRGGDPDLLVLPGSAQSIPVGRQLNRALLASSRRAGRRTETVTLRNRGRRSRNVYVFARVHATGNDLDAAYDLTIRRAR